MERRIAERHIAAAAAAAGGLDNITEADRLLVRQRILEQFEFLDRFAAQISRGELSDAQIAARIKLYDEAARGTFSEINQQVHLRAGFTYEQNFLGVGVANHCRECPAQSALGRVPIGSLIPIGQRTCLGNCRCRLRYYRSAT
jgi:hypothetical protein